MMSVLGLALTTSSPSQAAVEWSFIPVEQWVDRADPTARVFEGKLYVYTSWDHTLACSKSPNQGKKQGFQQFCMPGYRAYSTADTSLNGGWVSHGVILAEEDVPWVYGGDPGWTAAARMWAPDVVQGDDGDYYLFFPAPQGNAGSMKIGVAVSSSPAGPFTPRNNPIGGSVGIDPSVIKLANGQWIMFSSGSGEIWVQELDNGFWNAGTRSKVNGLESGYKEGPFAELRGGNLMLHYALSIPGGYRIQQAGANNVNQPTWGFWDAGVAIGPFDGRTNHGSVVTFGGNSWAFYHRHMEPGGAPWAGRRVVFSPVTFQDWGKQNRIDPSF